MKQINYKKLIIPNIPYVFFVYLFDKVGQATRLAPGADISEKILNITQGFSEAFSNALPSVHPLDLLIGIVGAVVIRLIVYVNNFDGIINNTPQTPTVADLEQRAKAGEAISVTDLAKAVKAEKREQPQKKPSILKKLDEYKKQAAQQPKDKQKEQKKDLEV